MSEKLEQYIEDFEDIHRYDGVLDYWVSSIRNGDETIQSFIKFLKRISSKYYSSRTKIIEYSLLTDVRRECKF